jgi:hypothetical protein
VPVHIFRQAHPRQKIIAGLQWKAFEREKVERVLAEKVSVIGRQICIASPFLPGGGGLFAVATFLPTRSFALGQWTHILDSSISFPD